VRWRVYFTDHGNKRAVLRYQYHHLLRIDRPVLDSVNDLLIHLGGRFTRCWDLFCVADKDFPTSIG